METNTIICRQDSLMVSNLEHAHEKYGNFVDIYQPMLDIPMFRHKCKLPLNEECDAVFYTKTAHLKDTDYIEIDRSILEMIGFKNIFIKKKDKHGNIKVDENGNIKLEDTRSDFKSAIRCLRNMEGFCESDSFDNNEADYVIKKAARLESSAASLGKGGSGLNRQEVWVRKRMLEHLVIMANTRNSRKIRDYFIDLKHIVTEYIMYQTVYRSKYEISIKETMIGELRNDIHTLMTNTVQLNEKIDIQSQKLDMMAQILYKESENKVIDVKEKLKKQELVILRKKTEPNQIEILRGQANHVNQTLKRKQNEMELVGKIDSYKNPINLFNRFGESIKTGNDERFKKSNNKIVLRNGSTVEDLMTVFHVLDGDKHTTAINVKNCI